MAFARGRADPGRPDARRHPRRDGPPPGAAARGRQLRLAARLRAGPRRGRAARTRCPTLLVVVDEFSELLAAKPDFIDLFVHDRPARPVARRAPAARLAAPGGGPAARAGHATCPTGSACARSPRWRAASCSACRTPTSCPARPATATCKFGHRDAGPVPGRVRLRRVPGGAAPATGRQAAGRPGRARTSVGYVARRASDAGRSRAGGRADAATDRAGGHAARRPRRAGCAGAGPPAHQVWLPPLDDPPTLDELLPPLDATPSRACARSTGTAAPVAVRAGRASSTSRSSSAATRLARPRRARRPRRRRRRPAERQEHAAAHADHRARADPHPARGAVLLPRLRRRRAAGARRPAARRRVADPARPGAGPPHGRRGHALLAEPGGAVRRGTASTRSPPTGGCARAGAVAERPVRRRVPGRRRLGRRCARTTRSWRPRSPRSPPAASATASTWSSPLHRWMELRPALRDLFGTRLELRLGDPTDSEFDRRVAADVPEGAPGPRPDRATSCTSWPRCRASTASRRSTTSSTG